MFSQLSLLVLCLAWSAEASDASYKCYKCEDGFYIYKRRCYKEITTEDSSGDSFFTYEAAKEGCHELDAKLVSISSQHENDFVASLLSPGSFHAWIGLTIKEPNMDPSCDAVCRREGWEWIDYTPYDYQNWGLNMPLRGRSCATINSRGFWLGFDCLSQCQASQPAYVCEKAAIPTKFCACDCEKKSEELQSLPSSVNVIVKRRVKRRRAKRQMRQKALKQATCYKIYKKERE